MRMWTLDIKGETQWDLAWVTTEIVEIDKMENGNIQIQKLEVGTIGD